MAVDVREKLVELLKQMGKREREEGGVTWYDVTDHLIAHGVTVQEWISVDDRLPEDNSNVMACLWIGEESRVYRAFYARGVWWDCEFGTPTTNTTTHWQPMPQPPKGE